MVQKLIEDGVELNHADQDHYPLLLAAVSSIGGNRLKIVQMLIFAGIDLNKTDQHGNTPLIHVSSTSDVELVRVLAEGGADLNQADSHGNTPLIVAIVYNQNEVARLLIKSGAYINLGNKAGDTPRILAMKKGNIEIARLVVAELDNNQTDEITIARMVLRNPAFNLKKNRTKRLLNYHEQVWPATDKRVAIKGSNNIQSASFEKAAHVLENMLQGREDILEILLQEETYIVINDTGKKIQDTPEFLGEINFEHTQGLHCLEMGMIMIRKEKMDGCAIGVLVHEIAHAIHLAALDDLDPSFDTRLQDLYKNAKNKGLWKGEYAMTNHNEYWAEGVASYFGGEESLCSNLGLILEYSSTFIKTHNLSTTTRMLDSKAHLRVYDRALFDLIDSVFVTKHLGSSCLPIEHCLPSTPCESPELIRQRIADIMDIVAKRGPVEMLQPLIAIGANVNQSNGYGNTPAILAAQFEQIDVLKALIEAGADVNKANAAGNSPLIFAAQNGFTEAIALNLSGSQWLY